jgi:2-furoyl-CoA dehydrogenase large subunit
VEITGKVAAVGGRLLEGATRVVISQFFERLVAQVGEPGIAAVPWWRRLLRLLGLGR